MLSVIDNVLRTSESLNLIYYCFDGFWERGIADQGINIYLPPNSIFINNGNKINEILSYDRFFSFAGQNLPYHYIVSSDISQYEMIKSLKWNTNIPAVLIQHRSLSSERPENLYVIKENDIYDIKIFTNKVAEENNRWLRPDYITDSQIEIANILKESEVFSLR